MSTDASDVTPDSPEDPDQKPKLTLEVQVDSPSTCQRHVTVSVSRDDIDRYCDEAFDELMPQAEVAGFRPGRAPRKLVESRFRDKIAEQVKGTVLMDTMTQVGEECDFSAISEPEFDFDAVDLPDEGPMTFEFNIEVRPEFEMPAWQGLKLDKPTKEVSEDAVKERTKSLLVREGSLTPREGGAELDDIVDANISFSLDGNTLSSIEDQTLVVRPRLSFMDGELDGFLEFSGARCAVLIDREGHLVTRRGDTASASLDTLAALMAGSFAATKEIAHQLGEESFSTLLHQGDEQSIQASLVGERTLLCVVWDERSNAGLIRFYAQETTKRLEQIFEEMAEGVDAPGEVLSDGYSNEATAALDDLF